MDSSCFRSALRNGHMLGATGTVDMASGGPGQMLLRRGVVDDDALLHGAHNEVHQRAGPRARSTHAAHVLIARPARLTCAMMSLHACILCPTKQCAALRPDGGCRRPAAAAAHTVDELGAGTRFATCCTAAVTSLHTQSLCRRGHVQVSSDSIVGDDHAHLHRLVVLRPRHALGQ